MDYASVQVMVVSLSAQEAVENSIRNLIVTKSVILHLPLYRTASLGQLLQLHTAFNNEKRPSPWTYSCPLDCNKTRQWFSLKYMKAAVSVNQRAGDVKGLQPPWWNMFFSIIPTCEICLNICSRMKEHLCLPYWMAAKHRRCNTGLFSVPWSVSAVCYLTVLSSCSVIPNWLKNRGVELNTNSGFLLQPAVHVHSSVLFATAASLQWRRFVYETIW